jgi:glycosyltransferase involved in cell wall biosynthesis
MAPSFRGIVTVSDSIARDVVAEMGLPAAKLVTVHNGIPDMVTDLVRSRGSAADEGSAVFLTIGRLATVKNQTLLLRAFALVLRARPKARLCVVGDGPEATALRTLAGELGLGDAVSLPGFRTDVRAFLAAADVFVLSSRHEGISMALLEAMQAGLPIVATRVGGVPETVVDGETGLLVASEDVEGMAEAMLRLARSADLRSEMGQRGQELQAREFSLRTMTERYLQIYGAAPKEAVA